MESAFASAVLAPSHFRLRSSIPRNLTAGTVSSPPAISGRREAYDGLVESDWPDCQRRSTRETNARYTGDATGPTWLPLSPSGVRYWPRSAAPDVLNGNIGVLGAT